MDFFLITLAFSVGFFLESIFGIGGTIISLAILSFFIEIKALIFLGFFVGTLASGLIFFTDLKHFSKKHFLKIAFFASLGIIIGSNFLKIFSAQILLQIFAIFLICFSLYSLLSIKKFKLPKIVQIIFIFFGGVMAGLFGTGGPLIVIAMQNEFKNKSNFRSTFAAFFLFSNLLRGCQYFMQKTFDFRQISEVWWIIFPITVAVLLGHQVHLKISEDIFKKGIFALLFISGISLLFKP